MCNASFWVLIVRVCYYIFWIQDLLLWSTLIWFVSCCLFVSENLIVINVNTQLNMVIGQDLSGQQNVPHLNTPSSIVWSSCIGFPDPKVSIGHSLSSSSSVTGFAVTGLFGWFISSCALLVISASNVAVAPWSACLWEAYSRHLHLWKKLTKSIFNWELNYTNTGRPSTAKQHILHIIYIIQKQC